MRERRAMYYKAFDFKSGRTYLIGQHKTKLDAEAWCKVHGMAVIAQTVIPLTAQEYIEAYENRPDREQKNDEIESLARALKHEEYRKEEREKEKKQTRREEVRAYQHDYYEEVTKPKRLAAKMERRRSRMLQMYPEVAEEIGSEWKMKREMAKEPRKETGMSEETKQVLRDLYYKFAELRADSLWREDIRVGFNCGCHAAMITVEEVLGEEVEKDEEAEGEDGDI